jgi:cardiolipin synthase
MNLLFWTHFIIATEWVIRLVMLPVIVLRKEQPAAALSWLAIIFFEPWIGLLLYMLIGESRMARRRIKRRRRRHAEFERYDYPVVENQYIVNPQLSSDHSILIHLAEEVGGLPVVGANHIEFIADYNPAIERLIEEIDGAKHHVHLLYYIFADDNVGRRVGEALIRARQRGVACRLLADHVGSRRFFRRLAPHLRSFGVEVVAALPAHFWRMLFKRLDLRNHRKLAVIDGLVAYTGSQNICDETYVTGERNEACLEVMARVTGPVVRQMQEIFVEDWYHETDQLLEDPALTPQSPMAGSTAVQLVPSGPDLPNDQFQDLIVKALFLAQRRIVLTTPYFVPSAGMLLGLRLAAWRGVRVDIVVPHRTDHGIVDAAGAFYLEQLHAAGIHVYYYKRGLLHSKTLTIDENLAMFGSANYDIRSFVLNFELNLLLHAPQAVADLHRLQSYYIEHAHLATRPEDWPSYTFRGRLRVNLAKLFSPLL